MNDDALIEIINNNHSQFCFILASFFKEICQKMSVYYIKTYSFTRHDKKIKYHQTLVPAVFVYGGMISRIINDFFLPQRKFDYPLSNDYDITIMLKGKQFYTNMDTDFLKNVSQFKYITYLHPKMAFNTINIYQNKNYIQDLLMEKGSDFQCEDHLFQENFCRKIFIKKELYEKISLIVNNLLINIDKILPEIKFKGNEINNNPIGVYCEKFLIYQGNNTLGAYVMCLNEYSSYIDLQIKIVLMNGDRYFTLMDIILYEGFPLRKYISRFTAYQDEDKNNINFYQLNFENYQINILSPKCYLINNTNTFYRRAQMKTSAYQAIKCQKDYLRMKFLCYFFHKYSFLPKEELEDLESECQNCSDQLDNFTKIIDKCFHMNVL